MEPYWWLHWVTREPPCQFHVTMKDYSMAPIHEFMRGKFSVKFMVDQERTHWLSACVYVCFYVGGMR